MRNDSFIVGLTGPSGAGKSTVSKVFEECGYTVINADKVARELLTPNSPSVKLIAFYFGDDIVLEDGSVDRRKLAARAFGSKEKTELLNLVTHPQICLRVLALIRKSIDEGNGKILFDAPVLFETNFDIMCSRIISVTAPREVRIQRLMLRDKLPREDIERRINAQHDDEYYKYRSHIVIDGGRELDRVIEDVRAAIKSFEEEID